MNYYQFVKSRYLLILTLVKGAHFSIVIQSEVKSMEPTNRLTYPLLLYLVTYLPSMYKYT